MIGGTMNQPNKADKKEKEKRESKFQIWEPETHNMNVSAIPQNQKTIIK